MTALLGTIFSALFGYFAPQLPRLFGLAERKMDNAHEIEMMKLRLSAANQEHLWRMEEVQSAASVAEMRLLHQPVASFGVQILDKARASRMPTWVIVPVFWAFALADWIATNVRPGITWAMVAFYGAVKWAHYQVLVSPRFENDAAGALLQIWGEQDWAVFVLIVSYWFGQRSALKK